MIKDIIIAILDGISIAQGITPPGHPARAAVILIIAGMVFKALLGMENLWDKYLQIFQRLCSIIGAISTGLLLIRRRISSWFRWYLIQLYTWPVEMAQRHQRRQVLIEYIERLRAMGEVKSDDVQCM